ncbi:MAG: hypothetical protein ACOH13_08930 [Flavobacteriales bacterium]
MSPAEKRYFKLHVSRNALAGRSNHQELFDAIAAMDRYDETKIRKYFGAAAFMRSFPITKRRLYEAVLASLDAFHSESSIDEKLRRMLHHVELLHRRALYADAAKVLQSAGALARTHQKPALLLQVAEWERRMMERGNYAGVTMADLAERVASVEGIAAQWQEVDRLWQLKSEVFLLINRNGQAAQGSELSRLQDLQKELLLQQGVALRSPRGRFLHHHVRSALAYAMNQLDQCELQLAACADVLRHEPHAFQEEPDLLLGVMGNLANVRMRMGENQQALDGFRAFRLIPLQLATAPCPDLEMKLFVMGYSLELSVRSVQGDFLGAMEQLTGLEEGLARYGERASTMRRAELALHAAYACFGGGAFEMCLRWCNRLLNEKGIEEHTELHALGRMMNVMTLVELDKEELLNYLLRNTQRYLKQHGTPFAVEHVLLDHVAVHLKAEHQRARSALWTSFAEQLHSMMEDLERAAVLDHIDLVCWAKAKAEGHAFQDLVRDKWSTRNKTGRASARGSGRQRAA